MKDEKKNCVCCSSGKSRDELLLEESMQPERWWYLSFVDETGFLGATAVKAQGIISATDAAREWKINPGGQVAAAPTIEEDIPAGLQYRLVQRDELARLFAEIGQEIGRLGDYR